MDQSLLKTLISRFSRHTFAAFIIELFSIDTHAGEKFSPLSEAGEDVFYQPLLDSYGGSIHEVFLLHSPPLELFHPSRDFRMDDPVLIDKLLKVRNLYKGKTGQWGLVSPYLRADDALKTIGFITNLVGIEQSVYQDLLIPAYKDINRFCDLIKPSVVVGSCDSFVEKVPEKAQKALDNIIEKYADGVVVSVTESDVLVNKFVGERCVAGGIGSTESYPYEPIFVSSAIRERVPLDIFQQLLRGDPSEAQLEDFLVTYYKDIFGQKYDRIETQLWLRFPELDIGDRSRRTDIFLRNSVANDWELFEIKRPVKVARTIRDVPAITHEVVNAIQQIKNYSRILGQDKTKKYFARQGIEYYEPQLCIVVGRTPSIPHEQWRWLKATNENQVKIITFDDLIAELRHRLVERYNAIEQLRAAIAGQ